MMILVGETVVEEALRTLSSFGDGVLGELVAGLAVLVMVVVELCTGAAVATGAALVVEATATAAGALVVVLFS